MNHTVQNYHTGYMYSVHCTCICVYLHVHVRTRATIKHKHSGSPSVRKAGSCATQVMFAPSLMWLDPSLSMCANLVIPICTRKREELTWPLPIHVHTITCTTC